MDSSPWLPPGALIASTGGSQSSVRNHRVHLIGTQKLTFCDTLGPGGATDLEFPCGNRDGIFYRMRIVIPFLLALTVGAGGGTAQTLPEDSLTSEGLEAHLRFIASDELEGRRTGSTGNAVAARYLAEHFRRWGLKPAGDLKGFLQPVPLLLQNPATKGTITTHRKELHIGSDFVLLAGTAELEAPVVSAGYGLVDEASDVDDYADLDVEGKIVVVTFGAPERISRSGQAGRRPLWSTQKRRLASERGAAGIVEILPGNQWRRVVRFLTRPRIVLRETIEGAQNDIFHALVRIPSGDPPEWETLKLAVPPVQADPLAASNVIGMIQGRDPRLGTEYLVLTAHYDHMGTDPNLRGDGSEDTIFNGARDNGMGVVALLAAARSLAMQPPRRSVLLIAMTGEEQGLLGSSYYVENPVVPLRKNLFVLNTDAAGFSDTGVVTIFGLRRISDRTLFEKACSRFGLETIPDPAENRDLFYRSDNVAFARKGIPALTFSPGFRTLDEETMKHYHRPSDEADDDFDYEYLLKFSQAFVASARSLADTDTIPVWSKGDEFEDAWQELYSGSRGTR